MDNKTPTHTGGEAKQEPEPLICMRDNVSVSAENPECPHPSSSCDFRVVCPVKHAMRRNRRTRRPAT